MKIILNLHLENQTIVKLYLIPTPIAEGGVEINREIIASIDYFVVENIRTARRYIASLHLPLPIDDIDFVELSEHTPPSEVASMLRPILGGRDGAVMSEAGLPCVADPGSLIVAAAHKVHISVIPLIGASSIMLSLMASGASGQNFAFNGYLPIKGDERSKALKFFERRALNEHQTQIFIETPYRNRALFEHIMTHCAPMTMLSMAVNLLSADQFVLTLSVAEWKKRGAPALDKRPAIFIIFTNH